VGIVITVFRTKIFFLFRSVRRYGRYTFIVSIINFCCFKIIVVVRRNSFRSFLFFRKHTTLRTQSLVFRISATGYCGRHAVAASTVILSASNIERPNIVYYYSIVFERNVSSHWPSKSRFRVFGVDKIRDCHRDVIDFGARIDARDAELETMSIVFLKATATDTGNRTNNGNRRDGVLVFVSFVLVSNSRRVLRFVRETMRHFIVMTIAILAVGLEPDAITGFNTWDRFIKVCHNKYMDLFCVANFNRTILKAKRKREFCYLLLPSAMAGGGGEEGVVDRSIFGTQIDVTFDANTFYSRTFNAVRFKFRKQMFLSSGIGCSRLGVDIRDTRVNRLRLLLNTRGGIGTRTFDVPTFRSHVPIHVIPECFRYNGRATSGIFSRRVVIFRERFQLNPRTIIVEK